MEEDHKLEEAGGGLRVLAIIQIAKEVPEEALFVLIGLRSQMDVDHQVFRTRGIFESMIPPGRDRRGFLAVLGESDKRLGIKTTKESGRTLLQLEELLLVNVIMKRRFDDRDVVLTARGKPVGHDVLGIGSMELDGGSTLFVDDRIMSSAVGPRRKW